MAYSSIGHVGYALMAVAANSEAGVEALLIYVAFYTSMTLGAFGAILSMRRSEGMVEDISELAGISKTNPMLAFMLTVLMFSLAGIPPLAGFWAKYFVFVAAIQANVPSVMTM